MVGSRLMGGNRLMGDIPQMEGNHRTVGTPRTVGSPLVEVVHARGDDLDHDLLQVDSKPCCSAVNSLRTAVVR